MSNIDDINNQKNITKDYIDLKLLFLSIERNKYLVFIFTFLSILFSLFIGFSQKKVWKGEFQIVIDSDPTQLGLLSSVDSRLLQFSGLNKNKKLETEVGILNSPSVLMNVFNFVKTKKSLGIKNESLRFKQWKESNLNINLKERTSILGITYKDTDKDLILPVLNKISKEYQTYSGNKRLRQIELGINFFENQIKIYKSKSRDSLNAAQTFAMDNDLSMKDYYLDNFDFNKDEKSQKNTLPLVNPRIDIGNKIKILDRKLKLIKEVQGNSEKIVYIASTIPVIRQDELFEKLNEIDLDISKLRVSFREKDNSIKEKLIEKKLLISLLKKQIEGYLDSERKNLLATLNSIERPRDILIKYNELVRNSIKDTAVLNSLEDDYRKVLLEKARLEDPWQLITKPTLYPYYVSPKKKRILFFGTFTGIISGILASLINDKLKEVIYSIEELEIFEKLNILATLSSNEDEDFEENIHLLAKGPLSNIKKEISFLTVGEIEESFLMKIKKSLVNFSQIGKNIFTSNLLEAIKLENIVLIIELGNIKKSEIKNIYKKLALHKNNIHGCIVIKND